MERKRTLRRPAVARVAGGRSLGWCVVALALATVAAAPEARAGHVSRRHSGQLVDVRVLVDGEPARLYAHPWTEDGRRYFEAFRGRRYALEIRNRTHRRIGVLITVDGLNVVSGERSGLGPHASMYVLDAYDRAVIRGWRTSLDHVRQFVFVDEERSYAERTGQANADMGWIRILAFEEEPRVVRHVHPRDEWWSQRDEQAPDGAPEARGGRKATESQGEGEALTDGLRSRERAPSFPGTGWGERRRDRVERTEFAAAGAATDHIVLRYEYAAGLHEIGVLRHRSRLEEREHREYGFARPPRR